MLYGAELWPLTFVKKKKLEAAHQVPETNNGYFMET